MNGLESTLRETAATLNDRSIGFALVGGLAVSVRVEPRLTRDIDIAVAVQTDYDAELLISSIRRPVEFVLEQEVANRMAAVRLRAEEDDVVLDLLFASSGIEAEIVDAAEPLEVFPKLIVPVATTSHLIALKLLSRSDKRPQDSIDLQSLSATATPHDITQAKEAVELITTRGFSRGRDLPADLETLIKGRRT